MLYIPQWDGKLETSLVNYLHIVHAKLMYTTFSILKCLKNDVTWYKCSNLAGYILQQQWYK